MSADSSRGVVGDGSPIGAERVLCANCHVREGTKQIGDALALSHGFTKMWCEVCLLEKQIAHCEERAAALPGLRARLEEIARG